MSIGNPGHSLSDQTEQGAKEPVEDQNLARTTPPEDRHDSHPSQRSSNGSIPSVSTATYGRQQQEAQDAFNLRIEQLCRDLWPPPKSMKHRFATTQAASLLRPNAFIRFLVPEPQIPLIEHLEGGGFNHITSVTLPASYEGYRDLILRIPREDDSRPEQHAATLRYVRENTSIPVATIETADFTCSNARGEIAKHVGKILKTLLTLESPITGIIDINGGGAGGTDGTLDVVPFQLLDACGNPVPDLEQCGPTDDVSPSQQSTLIFFEQHFARWKKLEYEVELFDKMLKVVYEMDDLRLFKPESNCLCHLDLHPRNIIVDIHSHDSIQITGILDWEDAIFAPKSVNCQPPGWIWGYDKDTHTENSMLPFPYELEGANHTPSTSEQQELKCIFDNHAGPEYHRLAYDHSSRLIRGLFRIAREGLTANWFLSAGERIVTEWDALRPTLASFNEE